MNLLQILQKANSEMENELCRAHANGLVEEATLEEAREVIDYACIVATDGSYSKVAAAAFLIAECGKQYPELKWEASMGLVALVKHWSVDVRLAIIDAAASTLKTPQTKDLMIQMKGCDSSKDIREAAEDVLLIWDED